MVTTRKGKLKGSSQTGSSRASQTASARSQSTPHIPEPSRILEASSPLQHNKEDSFDPSYTPSRIDKEEDSKEIQTEEGLSKLIKVLEQHYAKEMNPRTSSVWSEFRKFKPPAFEGSSDPMEAENWVMQLEKIWEIMECTEAQKVACATFMFKGEAEHWWRSLKPLQQNPAHEMNWDKLVNLLRGKYIPEGVRDKLAMDFQEIKQGNRTVLEYEREFTRLSRYAPALIINEAEKAKKFIRGLKPKIRV